MTAQNKSTQKPADASRFERITNGLVEAMKQLKSTIEKTKSTMNPAMLREQTLANVNVILDLYKKGRPPGKSAPSIIIADDEKNTKQVYAAVVRTRYDSEVGLTDLYMSIQGPSCNSDVQALEELYKLSRAAMRRAIIMTMNEDGFTDWDDLDLP